MNFKKTGSKLNNAKEKEFHLYAHYYYHKILDAQQTILEKTQINIFSYIHVAGASKMQWQWVLDDLCTNSLLLI